MRSSTLRYIVILILVVACVGLPLFACDGASIVEYEMTLLSPPDKLEYLLGETVLDVTGLMVTIKNSLTGYEETVDNFAGDGRFGIAGYDNTKVGKQTITLTLTVDGYTTSVSFDVEVLDVWAEEAKTVVDVGATLDEWYHKAQTEYASGVNGDDDIESRLYVTLGTSPTPVTITMPPGYQVGATKSMYRGYFEHGSGYENEIVYTPIRRKSGAVSIAWITLMTEMLPIKISCYDTIYTYEYPYTQELQCSVIEGQYICFAEEPAVKYCYIIDDNGIVSVESICNKIADPAIGWCVHVQPSTVVGDAITLVVPGYAKQTITLG